MTGTVFCSACGIQLRADAKFCAGCGERQEHLPPSPIPPQPPVTSTTSAPAIAPRKQEPPSIASGENILFVSAVVFVASIFILASTGRALSSYVVPLLACVGIAFGAWRMNNGGEAMSQQVEISKGSVGKIRNYWVGFTLTLLTLGFYTLFWYYFVNDELKDIGGAKGDDNLAQSSPALSTVAISIGGWLILPPFLSLYNYGQRINRAQRLGGVPPEQQINPTLAFLLFFPGIFLILPYFIYFWYVTKHQNAALRANAQPAVYDSLATAGAVA